MDKIEFNDNNKSIKFGHTGMAIDFGAIGKGIVVDKMPIQNWGQALSQLDIYFEGRLNVVLDI